MTDKRKLLLIEDDPDVRELYQEILTETGFKVDVAEEGETGCEKMKAGGYDLVLLDIMLPKKDGLTVLRDVRQAQPDYAIPVILLTNLGQEPVIKEGFSLGASGYMIKSEYTPDQIVDEVQKFLG